MRVTYTVLPCLVAAALAVAGCGSQGSSDTSTAVNHISYGTASAVKSGMPRRKVSRLLGKPVLTARGGTGSSPGGCVYYAMQGHPAADVWQFCFDKGNEVVSGATLYATAVPPPPPGASAARAALLGRADTICQGESADLAQPVKQLNRGLATVKEHPSHANRFRAAKLFGPFEATLVKTLSELEAFEPPADMRNTLAGYLDTLRRQTVVLPGAAAALAGSRESRYTRLLNRFNALGDAAAVRARRYGFSICSGITFS